MTNSSFAIIYNPYTYKSTTYIETNDLAFEMKISSFNEQKINHFIKVDSSSIADLSKLTLIRTNDLSTKKLDFTNRVSEIKNLIESQEVTKIIAARKWVETKIFPLKNILALYHNLVENFSGTFVYLFYLDNTIWIGASPELIGRTENSLFSTLSLAGTTHRNHLFFTEKEIEEQQIVTQFIEQTLETYHHPVFKKPTQALAFGSITHKVNEVSVELLNEKDFEILINRIHPSPALAGFPKSLAFENINSKEPLNRAYYCGMTSLKEANENFAFANIRCAKISANQITYYAGGGITNTSVPDNEYEETNAKINVLK